MECKKVPWPSSVIEEEYGVEDCGWPSKDYAYECKINLLTGKTHQVWSLDQRFIQLLSFCSSNLDCVHCLSFVFCNH